MWKNDDDDASPRFERSHDNRNESGYFALMGAGFGNSVVWTEIGWTAGSRIREWAADGRGVRTVVPSLPGDSCAVALGPNVVAGLMVDSINGCYDYNPNPRFWRKMRNEAENHEVSVSPAFFDGQLGVVNNMAASDGFQAASVGVRKDFVSVHGPPQEGRSGGDRQADRILI